MKKQPRNNYTTEELQIAVMVHKEEGAKGLKKLASEMSVGSRHVTYNGLDFARRQLEKKFRLEGRQLKYKNVVEVPDQSISKQETTGTGKKAQAM